MKISFFKKEWLVITIGWMLIYASTPLYMYYAMVAIDSYFDWGEVLGVWVYLTAFMVIFLLNHYILIPKLVVRKRIWQYVTSVGILAVLFTFFLQMVSPRFRPKEIPVMDKGPIEAFLDRPEDMPPPDWYDMTPMDHPEGDHPHRHGHRDDSPRHAPLLAPPDLARLVILLLMICVDWGIVAWFNEQKMRQRLLLLEQQNLKQELEHLRYQINPHFFMNTLNNIHVLIDVDHEQAQQAIIQLSRLMRYALYNNSDSMVPLGNEVEFVRLYISLMKLRYCDKIEIHCNMPEGPLNDAMIPPLLLATFVENAFKHGVSYQSSSFIYVTLEVNAEHGISFQCVNSCHPKIQKQVDEHHGIGLSNVKKRLDLQYGKHYSLIIDDHNEEQFLVKLDLPVNLS